MLRVLCRLAVVLGVVWAWGLLAPAAVLAQQYTINGAPVTPEVHQLLSQQGFPAGNYYIDQFGNFGLMGQAPLGNLYTGQVNPQAKLPSQQERKPAAEKSVPAQRAPSASGRNVDGGASDLAGARIFWVYSPSIFSGATGGSSGYIHICQDNVFHRSSEGSVSIGGEYDSQTGANDSWAGVAQKSANFGRWTVEQGANGPLLALYNNDGGSQKFLLSGVRQGRWKIGRTQYAVERGKASCP